ncbi:hypothetical protein B296_00007753 [Ensete ventricosum]|uniref:Uncharacterized protein n=1 Tax=Ensete ventricosum TaxID=4639 RepID=A0A427AKP5_ENSVE|nr:hypothetical protein B296_00007753 [Ensete ventricosum]
MNRARGSSLPCIRPRSHAAIGLGRELARKLSLNYFMRELKEEMDDGLSRLYHIRARPLRVVGKAQHIRESEVSSRAIWARKAPTHLFPLSGGAGSVSQSAELVRGCGLDHQGALDSDCLTGALVTSTLLVPKSVVGFCAIAEESSRPGPCLVRKLVHVSRGRGHPI